MGVSGGRPSYITDEMRGAVGHLVDWRISYPISGSDIRRWAVAINFPDDPPRRFYDVAYAESHFAGLEAPAEFNPFAWMVVDRMVPIIAPTQRDPDRLEKAIGIAGPGLVNQINGGTSATYGVAMRPGDVIRSETRLREYSERIGRMGVMLITLTESIWTNQAGELVRTEVNTAIRY